jgi:hypothetical protein
MNINDNISIIIVRGHRFKSDLLLNFFRENLENINKNENIIFFLSFAIKCMENLIKISKNGRRIIDIVYLCSIG